MKQVKPLPPQEKKVSLEDTMSELAKYQLELSKSQAQFVNGTRTSLTSQAAQLRNLEVQMGQMASLFNERQQGNLPSTSEVNPIRDGKEHCQAITLRSGKTIERPIQNSAKNDDDDVESEENNAGNSGNSDETVENSVGTNGK